MSRSQQQKREPVRDRNYVMPFGKYKGYSIADLIVEAPQYLEWLHHKTDFELDHILLEEVETSYEDAARNARLYDTRDGWDMDAAGMGLFDHAD